MRWFFLPRRPKIRQKPKPVSSRNAVRGTRMAIKQMRLEGYSYAAISKALNIPVKEIRAHMRVILNQQKSPAVKRKLKAPGRMPLSVYMSKGHYPHIKPVKSYVENPPTGQRLKYGKGYSKIPIPGTDAMVRAYMRKWSDPNLRHVDPYAALSAGRPWRKGTPETRAEEIPEHLRSDRHPHDAFYHRLEREPDKKHSLKMSGPPRDFSLEHRKKKGKRKK